MTTRPRSGGPASPAQDVANLGLVRPPLVYLISLVSGVVIQFATPFATPSRNAGQAGGTASRGGCHSAALVLGCDLLGRRHACTRAKAHHRDRTHGPLSLQPKPDLSGVFAAAARYRSHTLLTRYTVHRHRISNAIGYAKFHSRSHDALIRVYHEAGNVIETHKQAVAK